jgi:hypothetical protein
MLGPDATCSRPVSTMRLRSRVPGTRGRIAGYVYGTIVALAAVVAGASAYGDDLWRLAAIVGVSALVLWVAHVYAHGLGDSLTLGRRLTGAELAAVAGREISIAFAAVLPVAAIVLGAIGVFDGSAAVWIAIAIGVAGLAVQGLRYARLERLTMLGTAVSVGANVGLGLLIVAIKVIFAH